jgi:hypothetical protein
VTCLLPPAASWAAGPNFDAVSWLPLSCDKPDVVHVTNPGEVNFAGNAADSPAFYAYDETYLYFRFRMQNDPKHGSDLDPDVWAVLMQVPSGNRHQYQYRLDVNGDGGDTLEIWQNTTAADIDLSQPYSDAPEQLLYSGPFDRVTQGTSFNGHAAWFMYMAFPVQTLVAKGVISNPAELGQSFFFPLTLDRTRLSGSYLNCPFQRVVPSDDHCANDTDCPADDNACTVAKCSGGLCIHRAPSTCVPCTADANCDDANACTTDVCGATGTCQWTNITGCGGDGQPGGGSNPGGGTGTGSGTGGDNNPGTGTGSNPGTGTGDDHGNNAGDDHGGNPNRPTSAVEICGDCVDNDGDGLVDYEDPDCCERTDPLTLSRMLMRMRPQGTGDTLRLRSRGVAASASLDPRDGVTLQLSDGSGQLYCHDIGVVTTKAGLKHGVFRFRDKTGTLAAGLQTARFKIRKNGQLVFRATGKKMDLRNADGGLTVTLRVGGMCMQTTAALRARPAKVGTRNVFP